MQCLSIQIKPEAAAGFDKQDFLQRVRTLGRSPEVDDYEEKGVKHLHFNFFTEMPEALWQEIKDKLYAEKKYGAYLGSISLVACEGEAVGEDLLLHHYDPAEKVDIFPPVPSKP